MTEEIEYAWAAGFWDGEGCVSLTFPGKYKSPRIIVQVAQVDRRVLDRFCDIVGAGKVLGPYSPRHKNAHPYYCWRVEGNPHLKRLMNLLAPYLGEVKLEQMKRALLARSKWDEKATCHVGHPLSKSSSDKWYCPECFSIAGRKAAQARWGRKD